MDSFVLHDLQDSTYDDRWLMPGVEGLTAPGYRLGEYEKPGESGGVVSSEHYGSRVVTLPFKLSAPGQPEAFARLRREFIAACYITKDEYGFPVPKRFTGRTLDGKDIFFDGFVRPPALTKDMPTWAEFLITVVCPDQNIYVASQFSSGQVHRPAGGGVTLPVVLPVVFGAGSGGTVTIFNDGTSDTWPVITLRGVMTLPTIRHVGKDIMFRLNTELVVTDEVVIDMSEKTVVLNDSSSLIGDKTEASDWFTLEPGANQISFTTSLSGDTGTMEVFGYPALIGV